MKFLRSYSLEEISYLINAELILKTELSSFNVYGLADFFLCTKYDIVIFNSLHYLNYFSILFI